jgi:hypothetical protein
VTESGRKSINSTGSEKLGTVFVRGGLSSRLSCSHFSVGGIVGHEFEHLNGLASCGGDTDFGHGGGVATRKGAVGVGLRERGRGSIRGSGLQWQGR